jgi:hypothetical protein
MEDKLEVDHIYPKLRGVKMATTPGTSSMLIVTTRKPSKMKNCDG